MGSDGGESAARGFAGGEAQLGSSRRFEWRQRDQRDLDAEIFAAAWLGQTLDVTCGDEIRGQPDARTRHTREFYDTDAAHFEAAGDRVRRRGDEPAVGERQIGTIIGHESPPRFDQPQRQIGLAAPRWAPQQNTEPPHLDTARVNLNG